MNYRLEITPEAEDDVRRLIFFLADRNPRAAVRAEAVIRDAVNTLAQSPLRGRPTKASDIRELTIKFGKRPYIARYAVEADAVIVLGVRHSYERGID